MFIAWHHDTLKCDMHRFIEWLIRHHSRLSRFRCPFSSTAIHLLCRPKFDYRRVAHETCEITYSMLLPLSSRHPRQDGSRPILFVSLWASFLFFFFFFALTCTHHLYWKGIISQIGQTRWTRLCHFSLFLYFNASSAFTPPLPWPFSACQPHKLMTSPEFLWLLFCVFCDRFSVIFTSSHSGPSSLSPLHLDIISVQRVLRWH